VTCNINQTHHYPVTPCKSTDSYRNAMRTLKGRPTCGQKVKTHHIVSTHDLFLINEKDTFTKHRCYTYNNNCVCECVDAPEFEDSTTTHGDHRTAPITQTYSDRYQQGTIQGSAAGLAGSRTKEWANKNGGTNHKTREWVNGVITHGINSLGRMSGQKVFRATNKFWKPPQYYVSENEIKAVKKCCEKEIMLDQTFTHPAHNCRDFRAETPAQIKARLLSLSPTLTNTQLLSWLSVNGCDAPKPYRLPNPSNPVDTYRYDLPQKLQTKSEIEAASDYKDGS